jgi:hypothetical protein
VQFDTEIVPGAEVEFVSATVAVIIVKVNIEVEPDSADSQAKEG